MGITFRQIEAFLALIKHGNLTKAAASIGQSQPALSKTIAVLENELGNRLFHRIGQRLVLNDSGKALIPYAYQVRDSVLRLETRLTSTGTELKGNLAIGCTTSILNTVLVPVLASFMQSHPHLEIRLVAGNYRQTLERLVNFEIDVGLVASNCAHSAVETELWREDTLHICCSPGFRKSLPESATMDSLGGERWILRESGSGSRAVFDSVTEQALFKPALVLEIGSNEAIRIAAVNGMGLACLSMLLIGNDAENGTLTLLDVPGLTFKRPLNVITLRSRHEALPVSRFKDYISRTR